MIPETKHSELVSPWEQYKNAARRAKLLQHQLALATAEASRAAAAMRAASAANVVEEVPDSGRSVPDSGRSAGASSSGGSVGSRRLNCGRRLTPQTSDACDLQQQSLREDRWGEQREEEWKGNEESGANPQEMANIKVGEDEIAAVEDCLMKGNGSASLKDCEDAAQRYRQRGLLPVHLAPNGVA